MGSSIMSTKTKTSFIGWYKIRACTSSCTIVSQWHWRIPDQKCTWYLVLHFDLNKVALQLTARCNHAPSWKIPKMLSAIASLSITMACTYHSRKVFVLFLISSTSTNCFHVPLRVVFFNIGLCENNKWYLMTVINIEYWKKGRICFLTMGRNFRGNQQKFRK